MGDIIIFFHLWWIRFYSEKSSHWLTQLVHFMMILNLSIYHCELCLNVWTEEKSAALVYKISFHCRNLIFLYEKLITVTRYYPIKIIYPAVQTSFNASIHLIHLPVLLYSIKFNILYDFILIECQTNN